MKPNPIRLHVLHEFGVDFRPHSTSHIRLLRPLTHPSLSGQFDVTWGLRYELLDVDGVILDRLWHRDVSQRQIEDLIQDVKRRNAKLIYAIDDDLLTMPADKNGWPSDEHRGIVKTLLQQSAGVLVTTDVLRERFSTFNSNIIVIPNAIDERLLVRSRVLNPYSPFPDKRKVIGYMGTRTHINDLRVMSKALKVITDRFSEDVGIQIIGVAESEELNDVLDGIPYNLIVPPKGEEEYPQFMLWYSSNVQWDIAIAPLQDNSFNQCKSDLKFLDYAAIGAAGIYSDVDTYASIEHMNTGWKAANSERDWTEALDYLLHNDNTRTEIANNAQKYLYEERTLESSAENWDQAIHKILG